MNSLISEKSPYLLQHADNPVNWYPWSEEAFDKARKEDKPVFLSIGYATCHWCHVMAHESFEDEEVARLMNDSFVNIKVDREERPDIDNTYMTICQMITGRGGWPLTVVMTPDREPFYAATYIPKNSHPNRMGMLDFVPAIDNAWKNDRDNIMQTVQKIKKGFSKTLDLGKTKGSLPDDIVKQARNEFGNRYDEVKGGFGSAPKFPSPHNLLFLLNYHRLYHDQKALQMVSHTLRQMRLGGIWDHVGFGFHRYSTDHVWLLPHFEKMLYDQAMLLLAYSEAWKISHDPLFKQTAYEIVNYVGECLTAQNGAFYSAEDADSEGEEGTFYIWGSDEIDDLLTDEDSRLFKELFNFEPDGNFLDEATQQKTGKNIPHLSRTISEEASERKIPEYELEERLRGMLDQLKNRRQKRERPLLDDKILTDWNGLMISALCRAGIIFGEAEFIKRAEKAWTTLENYCLKKNGKLLHRLKDSDSDIEGMANDYAYLIFGLIHLYDATFRPEYLKSAIELQEQFDKEFLDTEYGGYYFTGEKAESLMGRQKEIYDGAIPSSNSVAAYNLLGLARRTGNPEFEERATHIFKAFSAQIEDTPSGYAFAVDGYQLMNAPLTEIVVVAPEYSDEVRKSIDISRNETSPGSSVLLKTPKYESGLREIAPFTDNYPVGDQISIYVCKNFKCEKPIHGPEELKKFFNNK